MGYACTGIFDECTIQRLADHTAYKVLGGSHGEGAVGEYRLDKARYAGVKLVLGDNL